MYKAIIFFCLIIVLINSAQKDYTEFVNFLAQKIKEPNFKGSAYERLAYITDTYGARMWGSTVLEQVIHEMLTQANKEGFENIRL